MFKKILFLSVIFLCFTVYGARQYDIERGNDLTHIETARRIAGLDGVQDAAVLSCKNRILVGVRLDNEEMKVVVEEETKMLVAENFPDAGMAYLFVGGKEAEAVVELSMYMESGMSPKVLRKRFEFLIGRK